MSTDPVLSIARQRIIKISADLEVQLATRNGSAPAIEILRRLRERAAESLAALAFLNLDDPNEIVKAKTLQNEVKRYDEWLGWMKEIIAEGIAYDRDMRDEEREEMLDLLTQTQEGREQAIELGLIADIPRDS